MMCEFENVKLGAKVIVKLKNGSEQLARVINKADGVIFYNCLASKLLQSVAYDDIETVTPVFDPDASGVPNFKIFMSEHKDILFRYLVKKTIFTPYEQTLKSQFQSKYEEDGHFLYAYITDAVEIPGDILLELTDEDHLCKSYYLLSHIELSQWIGDNEDENLP